MLIVCDTNCNLLDVVGVGRQDCLRAAVVAGVGGRIESGSG